MVATSTPTRERLLTEAWRLFSEKGFEAASVSQIEAAAGLSAGSGALYRHFKSKDDVLAACIDRQLDRRLAMQNIHKLFVGLSDLQSELTVVGRYLFSVIDDETELIQITARTPPGVSERLDNAYAALIDTLRGELCSWISSWVPHTTSEQAGVLATVSLNSLLGQRFTANIIRRSDAPESDETYLIEWTTQLAARLQNPFS